MATNVTSAVPIEPKIPDRWVQMCACIIAMMAIANLQYAWTLFTKPLTLSLHATLAAVQIAFAAFIFCETWLVPFEGYLIDRRGLRLVIGIGGLLVGAGWIGSGYATTTTGLYIWYATGGIGAGAVYGGCTGNVLKWFPDHRGLCAGIVAGANSTDRVPDVKSGGGSGVAGADPARAHQQAADPDDQPRPETINQVAFEWDQPGFTEDERSKCDLHRGQSCVQA